MFVRELLLSNYRNYRLQELNLFPGIYIVHGGNGQGKSNLLEAIYQLCTGHSYRTASDADIVRWGDPGYTLRGKLYMDRKLYRIEVNYDIVNVRKTNKLNGRNIKNYYSVSGPVVFFVPEDLQLIRLGPDVRRRFLDREISRANPLYRSCLGRYKKVILQKNRLLKEIRNGRDLRKMLPAWNRQLAYLGSRLIQQRASTVSSWGKLAEQNYSFLFQDSSSLKLLYSTFESTIDGVNPVSVEEIEQRFLEKLSEMEGEEYRRGCSLVGPHRDDLLFMLNGREAGRFASHGQQRSIIISLKGAQLQHLGMNSEKPLFLLDDVFSELDEQRKKQCLSLFNSAEQVFIATAQQDGSLLSSPLTGRRLTHLVVNTGSIKEHDSYGKNRAFS